jgi:hypothetical protein
MCGVLPAAAITISSHRFSLFLSCARSVSHCLSISLHTQKFLANGALCCSLARSPLTCSTQFKISPAREFHRFGLILCAFCRMQISKPLVLGVCQVALTFPLVGALLILISSAFWNLREIKVVCRRTCVCIGLAGANDDDRQGFYRYAEQKSVVCVRNTVLQEFTRTTHTTHERIKMPVGVIVSTFFCTLLLLVELELFCVGCLQANLLSKFLFL